MIDGYEVADTLGRGTAGVVVRAVHRATGASVAIKVVSASSPQLAAAVEHEVRAMAQVNHPNLLTIYDQGVLDDGSVWMATELANGGSLEAWQPSSFTELEEVLDDVLAGLAHAHSRGLVHRDLKPANLLLARRDAGQERVMIGDFGLSVGRGQDDVIRGGTPMYMAPEQLSRDERPQAAADVYALGAVIWHWVTGRPVFEGLPRDMIRQHRIAPPPSFRPCFDVPAELEPLLRRMLAKRPGARPATVGEVRRSLRARPVSVVAAMERATGRIEVARRLPGVGQKLLALRDHVVVGRVAERRQLVAALTEVVERGQGRVRLLTGGVGMGKTRLMRWVGETAEEAGVARCLVQPTVGQVEEAARTEPVVALFDDLSADLEPRVLALAYLSLPVLVVGVLRAPDDLPNLRQLVVTETLGLGPMPPSMLRQFVLRGLGLADEAVVDVASACDGPGQAVEWMVELAATGQLMSTRRGFRVQGELPPPRSVDDRLRAVLSATLAHGASAGEQAALRLGAVLGPTMADDEWSAILSARGLARPSALVRQLAARKLLVHDPVQRAWCWVDPTLPAVVLQPGASPAEHLAASQAMSRLAPTESRRVREGLHLLRAGLVPEARAVLLRHYDDADLGVMEQLRAALHELRPHLHDASATERFWFQVLRVRVRLNLVSVAAALPLVEELVPQIGSSTAPGPLWTAVDHDGRQHGLHLLAAVYCFAGRVDAAERLVADLDPSARTSRLLGMIAGDRGQHDAAATHYAEALRLVGADEALRGRILNGLGAVRARSGRLDEAARCFRACADMVEVAVRQTAMANLARVLVLLGRYEEAATHAREALQHEREVGRSDEAGSVVYALAAALAGWDDEAERVLELALFTRRRGAVISHALAAVARQADLSPRSRRCVDALLDADAPITEP